MGLSAAEQAEYDGLHAKVRERHPDGRFRSWTLEERDRVRALTRKARPWLRLTSATDYEWKGIAR